MTSNLLRIICPDRHIHPSVFICQSSTLIAPICTIYSPISFMYSKRGKRKFLAKAVWFTEQWKRIAIRYSKRVSSNLNMNWHSLLTEQRKEERKRQNGKGKGDQPSKCKYKIASLGISRQDRAIRMKFFQTNSDTVVGQRCTDASDSQLRSYMWNFEGSKLRVLTVIPFNHWMFFKHLLKYLKFT